MKLFNAIRNFLSGADYLEEKDEELRLMGNLHRDFPPGSVFEWSGRSMTVRCFGWSNGYDLFIPAVVCDYLDDKGRIREHVFSPQDLPALREVFARTRIHP